MNETELSNSTAPRSVDQQQGRSGAATEAIASLERLAAINATMSLYAMQKGDTHGAIELRGEARRITTLIAGIGSRQNVPVRRFVVQERYSEKTECDWYDDPDISESVTLEDARTRLEKDLRESRGHGDAYLHRVIERTERVVQSPNDQIQPHEGRAGG